MTEKCEVILVFGLPGAGKTTTINLVVEREPNLVRVSGGSLINADVTEAERDRLRKLGNDEILRNQELLVLNFQKFAEKNRERSIIFDGHCVIKDGNRFVEVPELIIQGFSASRIIFLNPSPVEIIKRRASDENRPDRETETVDELSSMRDRQIEICKKYSAALNIPFEIIDDPSPEKLYSKIKNINKTKHL